MLADAVAAVLFLGVVLYAVFGGADFGSGFWDLLAGGDERGAPARTLIDQSVGPVWEANHTWLIFVLVYLWTGFPTAFAAISETLFVPLSLAGLGIVLRGSGFAFRKFAPSLGAARLFGALFAASSVVTPFVLGAVAGAIASGRVPLDGHGDLWSSWTGPTSMVGGLLAVATCAFVAGVLLTAEARHRHEPELEESFRRRALGIGAIAGLIAAVGIVPLHDDAPELFHGLTHRAVPLIAISVVTGIAALVLLVVRRPDLARLAAIAAVGAVVVGWGVAQYPAVLVGQASIDQAAAPDATLWGLVVVTALVLVTVVPALGYLYKVTQRELVESTSSAPQ